MKSDLDKIEVAGNLYSQGKSIKDIANIIGMSEKTVRNWSKRHQWNVIRGAKMVSIDNIVQKALVKIDSMLDNEEFNADAFSKAVAQLKKLKPDQRSIDDYIVAFEGFGNFIHDEAQNDKEITKAFYQKVTSLQSKYIIQISDAAKRS